MPGYGRDCEGNCILMKTTTVVRRFGCVPNQDGPDVYNTVEDSTWGLWAPPIGSTSTQKTRRTRLRLWKRPDAVDHFHTGRDIQRPIQFSECVGIIDAFFEFFPDWEYDSYGTIGLEGPAANVAELVLSGARRRSDAHGERLLPNGRHPTQRQHAHWCFLVRVARRPMPCRTKMAVG